MASLAQEERVKIEELDEMDALDEAQAKIAESEELSKLPLSITREWTLTAQRGDKFFKGLIAKSLS